MSKIIYQVDAFTNEIFKGNPAGVMLLQESIDDKLMQNIAAEMNLSETAFVNLASTPYEIRFFTPTVEIPLCGHATLASAHILYENDIIPFEETIHFKAKGGDLLISKKENSIQMSFPKYEIEQVDLDIDFNNILGFTPIDIYRFNSKWIILQVDDQKIIENYTPNFGNLIENNLGHLIITSTAKDPSIDFVLRCFAPGSGINEDPVTGSIQCALAPFWHLKTSKTVFKAKQLSKRTGLLDLSLVDNTVEISGQAITVFEARLK